MHPLLQFRTIIIIVTSYRWICVCKLRTQDTHYEVRSACCLTCQMTQRHMVLTAEGGGTLGRGRGSRQLSASVSPEQGGQRGHWPCGESSSPGLAALTGPASQAPHSVSLAVSEWQSAAIQSSVLATTSKLSGPESVSPNIPLDGFIHRFDHPSTLSIYLHITIHSDVSSNIVRCAVNIHRMCTIKYPCVSHVPCTPVTHTGRSEVT